MVAVVALTVAVAGGASAPAGAAPVDFALAVPEGGGQLSLRGATEPVELGAPTTLTGTVDDETGAITGTLATPTLRTERPVTQPVTATAVIDATFSPTGPGATTGSVDSDGNVTLQTRLTVDLHVEVFFDPSLPPALVSDCRSTPVVLTLESTAPYTPDGGGSVTVADDDFTIPAPANTGSCTGPVYDALQADLTGPGHSLSMTLGGALPLPEPPGAPTVTTLIVDPASQSRLGEPITMTAAVAAGPGSTEPGAPAGLVDFLVDDRVVGTVALDDTGRAAFTTDELPSGTFALSARYKGQSPFRSSPSAVVEHLVAADPTVTTTLPEYVAHGGTPTEFDVVIGNSQGGVPVATPGIQVAFVRQPSSSSTLSGLVLERLSGQDWVPVPLTAVTGVPGVSGGMTDASWGSLAPGGQLTIRMRLAVAAPTQAGSVRATFALVDDLAAPTPAVLASGSVLTTMIASDRQPSTLSVGNAFVVGRLPAVVRQGNLFLLRSLTVQPAVGGQPATGHLAVTVDGRPVGLRGSQSTLADGFQPTVPLTNTLTARMPVDVRPGTVTVVVSFLGDTHRLPSQATLTIEVIPAGGSAFTCQASVAGADRVAGLNLVALANLPTQAPSGSTVPVGNQMVRALVDRGPSYSAFGVPLGNGSHVVGQGALRGVTFDYGPAGTGSATGYDVSNASLMTATGSDPDLVVDMKGEAGSVTVTGEPGDVVPVTLERITLDILDPTAGGIPYDLVCEPLGDPVELGRVTVVGATLSVDAPPMARVGDEVTLSAEVVPAEGSVEFFAGETSLGFARVVDGRAVRTTKGIPAGDHAIVARHTAGRMVLASNAVALTVLPELDCAGFAVEGNGAVVRLVYMELLGRCPDQAGFDHWTTRLDGGTPPEAFARTIARTSEAVGRVVDDAYETMLGRAPDPAGRTFWVRSLQASGRYDRLLADLGASGEFWSKAGGTNAGFVTRVYERLLDRAPDSGGLRYWTDRLGAGASRRGVITTLANLDEPLGRLAVASYGEILGRDPFAGERRDAIAFLRATGDRSGLYAQLIGRPEFSTRAQGFPNPED